MKRVFLVVMDSVGCGELPDAYKYGDEGSHTLRSCTESSFLDIKTLRKLGIFNIDAINCGEMYNDSIGSYGKMNEFSPGKDTTTGHWEISGIHLEKAFPTFPNGFPDKILDDFKKRTGRNAIVNKPYSGTKVIDDYGKHHVDTGDLIVYTSADSVFQIAAHEDVVSIDTLYEYCKIAREILVGEYAVGRVIARPFTGEYPHYERTSNRHDFSVKPTDDTLLTLLKKEGLASIGIGKIYDIFAGVGVTETIPTTSNSHGMDVLNSYINKDFNGLCFLNLVDFDMKYGHRNDVDGYAKALTAFDIELNSFMGKLKQDDILLITADHGCDPKTSSTDHSREYVPILVYGKNIKKGVNLGIRPSFSDIAMTVADYFNLKNKATFNGSSFLKDVIIK